MSKIQQETQPLKSLSAVDEVGATVIDVERHERKPWNLAVIDVAVTLLMVGLVLGVLNVVTMPADDQVHEGGGRSAHSSSIDAISPIEVPAPSSSFSSEAYLDTVASIEGDEYRQRDLVLVGQGWVEHLVPLRIGQRVFRGQLLLEVYSPALIDLQMEYIEAVKSGELDLIQDAVDHLTVYGQSPAQVEAVLNRERLDGLISVRAPSDGVISALYVEEGMFVPMAGAMVRLVDMSSVWMEAELLNLDAKGVEPGSRVEASLPRSNQVIQGVVEYVEYPERHTGPVKVRMRFDGVEQRSLGRGYVDVRIYREDVG